MTLREVLARHSTEVAPLLLGATITGHGVSIRLTEVEAYEGLEDPASHAYRGQTPRNATMFGPAAHLYVYFTYGMHYCANVVCGEVGVATAVLLRAGEVTAGVELARERRRTARDLDLARGPARLAQALGLTREHDGADLVAGPITLALAEPVAAFETGPRVGVSTAADIPWRYWLPGERSVSPYRAAVARPRRTARKHPRFDVPDTPL